MPASSFEETRASVAFGQLAEPIRRWIWEKGWTGLRDIQERAIPLLIGSDCDVIISAATAGGKTEAAFLPLISQLVGKEESVRGFDLVYVSPLKALINDQFRRLDDLCDRTGIPVYRWHGDVSASIKARARKQPKGILLITPESLEALFVLRGLELRTLFAGTSAVIIDELHALLDTERGIQLRSLLTRLEIATARSIRRIGLSATLGNMDLARAYLRPQAPEAVQLLQSRAEGSELRMQLRGYRVAARNHEIAEDGDLEQEDPAESARRAISEHLFATLRGKQNLVFAGARQRVELLSDLLRRKTEELGVPEEFFPHHANLSRDHRVYVEERLKAAELPTTAICTSTLELGIDIGDVEQVAQIGAPFSVASLRQRIGRSGRRPGKSAVLRAYVEEQELEAQSHPADQLRLELVRTVAMIDLLIEGWCEPPSKGALHLSTLLHQVLSVIAQNGGTTAARLFNILCQRGPFTLVDPNLFARLLHAMGDSETALIEQSPDSTLLLGREGERLVEHYSFYAVFQTPVEYRVIAQGKTLGQLPAINPLSLGTAIIFSGRRWRVVAIHERDLAIEVVPDPTGIPPRFGGEVGLIHDVVIGKMRNVLAGDGPRRYLDATAGDLLEEGRAAFQHLGLSKKCLIATGEKTTLLAPWVGTAKLDSLALALNALGAATETYDGLIQVIAAKADVRTMLQHLAERPGLTESELVGQVCLPQSEKYHAYLPPDLLFADVRSSRLDFEAIPRVAALLLEGSDDTVAF